MRRLPILAVSSLAAALCACSAGAGGHATLPPAPASVSARCSGIAVTPGSDRAVQTILDHGAAGATFCFAPGTYRFARPIAPKTGQQLVAARHGVVLTGAKIVARFVRSGSNYRAKGFLQGGAFSSTNCLLPGSGCNTTQDVFLDGKPLARVTSVARLAAGAFYEDFARNLIWLRDDPSGHIVEQAYAPAIVASNHGSIGVRGFVVEMAASPAQHGALQAIGYRGNGWTIEGNEVRFNHGAGITSAPPDQAEGGSMIENNFIHDNGQEGIGAGGPGLVVAGNEIAFNNRANYDCGWECGGAKFAGADGTETTGLSATGNYVHDNAGPGLWCDINSYNVIFKHNRIENNRQVNPKTGYTTGSGIFLEISDRAVVADNTLKDNGPIANSSSPAAFYEGGQILLSATPNVTVRNNVASGAIGIGMLQQARSDSCRFGAAHSKRYPDGTPVCPYAYRGLAIHWVHDESIFGNTIVETARSGNAAVAGLDSDLLRNGPVFAAANGIVYSNNAYTLANSNGRYFEWKNATIAKGAWLAQGQDKKSTFR